MPEFQNQKKQKQNKAILWLMTWFNHCQGRQHIKSGGGGCEIYVYIIFEDQYLSRFKRWGITLNWNKCT